jgi:hypothetical protein
MATNPPERRRQKRTRIEVPVKIRPQTAGEVELSAQTRDLSSAGIFLYSDAAVEPGAKFELVLMLPPELGLGVEGWTVCQASVVRVEECDGKGLGIAATFDRIEVLPVLS